MAATVMQWGLATGAALLPLLVVFLCAVARQYIGKLKDERLRELILRLVEAAEQVYGAGGGNTKLSYVKGNLRKLGYEPDEVAIEAAVLKVNETAARTACCKAGAVGPHLGQPGG